MYDENLGRFMAYILRHAPEAAGVELDDYGYAEVGALIAGIAKSGRKIDLPILTEIVEEDEKMRFSFNAD
ncbi:MAG: RNA 2'-phosphotransferase, partial [Clostridiales bacterium]|nr:RNA 2'-phosphotransferase [Clostridiales bacterium]